jgi:allantoate deiminase
MNEPLGVVASIAGQSRLTVHFIGQAAHAGTTPMNLRRDALAGAARWIARVEDEARSSHGLVATVGRVETKPGAGNVIPAQVTASLDVRHASDEIRSRAIDNLITAGNDLARERGLEFRTERQLDQRSVEMDPTLVSAAVRALQAVGCRGHRMTSGAGHDAMILAEKIPSVMIFLRSPGGISHHPGESVLAEDVQLALAAVLHFLHGF